MHISSLQHCPCLCQLAVSVSHIVLPLPRVALPEGLSTAQFTQHAEGHGHSNEREWREQEERELSLQNRAIVQVCSQGGCDVSCEVACGRDGVGDGC